MIGKFNEKVNKSDDERLAAEEIADGEAIQEAINILTDLFHISENYSCFMQLWLNSNSSSSIVDVTIRVMDIGCIYDSTIRNYEHLKEENILAAAKGKISMDEMTNFVREYDEKLLPEGLSSIFLNKKPTSYLFSDLRRGFVKTTGDGDVEIEHAIFVDKASGRGQIFLRVYKEKCKEVFPDCNISSDSETHFSISF